MKPFRPSAGDRARGFTLVELLVVLALIMILLMLMAPALLSARDKAFRLKCAANLRSIGISAMVYASEHNNEFPDANYWGSGSAAWGDWYRINSFKKGTLYPYLNENREYLRCPVFMRTYQMANPNLIGVTPVITYTMNHFFAYAGWNCNGGINPGYAVHKAHMTDPSTLGLFGEENVITTAYNNYILNDLRLGVGAWQNKSSIIDGLASYHQPIRGNLADGHGNVCFADGHVELAHHSQSKEIFTPEAVKARYR